MLSFFLHVVWNCDIVIQLNKSFNPVPWGRQGDSEKQWLDHREILSSLISFICWTSWKECFSLQPRRTEWKPKKSLMIWRFNGPLPVTYEIIEIRNKDLSQIVLVGIKTRVYIASPDPRTPSNKSMSPAEPDTKPFRDDMKATGGYNGLAFQSGYRLSL